MSASEESVRAFLATVPAPDAAKAEADVRASLGGRPFPVDPRILAPALRRYRQSLGAGANPDSAAAAVYDATGMRPDEVAAQVEPMPDDPASPTVPVGSVLMNGLLPLTDEIAGLIGRLRGRNYASARDEHRGRIMQTEHNIGPEATAVYRAAGPAVLTALMGPLGARLSAARGLGPVAARALGAGAVGATEGALHAADSGTGFVDSAQRGLLGAAGGGAVGALLGAAAPALPRMLRNRLLWPGLAYLVGRQASGAVREVAGGR